MEIKFRKRVSANNEAITFRYSYSLKEKFYINLNNKLMGYGVIGNIQDFDSCVLGSNPSTSANTIGAVMTDGYAYCYGQAR